MMLRYAAPFLALALAGCDSLTINDVPPVRGAVEVEVAVAPGLLETNRMDHVVRIEIQAHHPNDELDTSYTTNLQSNTLKHTFDSVPPVLALVKATATKVDKVVAEATASVSVTSSKTATLKLSLPKAN
jgi:hypothetical protein